MRSMGTNLKKRLFAVSGTTYKYKDREIAHVVISGAPGYVVAENQDEAVGKAYAAYLLHYPPEEGYAAPVVNIIEVPLSVLEELGEGDGN